MEIAYYPGCTLQQSSALYDVQSQRVFKELGITLKEIEDWNCCGATSAGKYDDFTAIAMPARNIGIAEQDGYTEMVIPCSACYSRTLVAQQCLEDDPALKDEINAELAKKVRGGLKVSSILEVLLTTVESGVLAAKVVKKYKTLKPVCYYGCMQTRFPYGVPVPDDVENPQGMETILKTMGINALDWNYKTDCCGASAAINDHDTSINLMAKIMRDAIARGANCFVVTCPMCQLNLDAYQDEICKKYEIPERLPVYFITELVGLAIGLSPKELQIDRHFVDSVTLVKKLDKELEAA
jgi:heterodisulfide reductase subunit B